MFLTYDSVSDPVIPWERLPGPSELLHLVQIRLLLLFYSDVTGQLLG